MNKLNFSATLTIVCLAFSVGAWAQNMSKIEYQAARKNIDAEYQSAKANCGSHTGNTKDICMAEAQGKNKVAKTELEASYKPSIKAGYLVSVARAEADYTVAKEKCDDKAGTLKEVCLKEAKSTLARAKSDARAKLEISGNSKVHDESHAELIKMYYGD